MSFIKKYSDQLILLGILLLGALLRFHRYADWSLSNDELSAITRLNFPDLNTLLKDGVRPDYHPAGVEVFLFYWIKIFGNSVAAIRLPFVLCGIASIYYTYLIAKKWFSVQAAQFSALAIACLTYPILYSQLARPYSPGLLFSLVMVYYWSKLLFDTNSTKKTMLAYAISTALCMYMHYFSFMFAIIVGFTGFIFLNKNNYKDYILAGLISVFAFIPHISISIEQLSRGGIGSWLGKPEKTFFKEYLFYSSNESLLLVLVAVAIIFISVVPGLFQKQNNKFRSIALSWFMLPFLIGYWYSRHINPVLQYSVLLFSFPFLLIFLFSYVKDIPKIISIGSLTMLMAFMIWTGVKGQKFYWEKPFAEFKGITKHDLAWTDKYGAVNTQAIYNVISPSYLDYYFNCNSNKNSSKHTYFRGDDTNVLSKINEIVQKCNEPYFIYGWTNNICPPEIYEIIKMRFPEVVEDHVYFNSRTTLFSQGTHPRKIFLYTSLSPGKQWPGWNYDIKKVDSIATNIAYGFSMYTKVLRMDSTMEFSGGFEGKLNDLYPDSINYLNLEAGISSHHNENVNLVIEFHKQENDSMYAWHSVLGKNAITNDGTWSILLLTQKIPPEYRKGDKIKVYVWNPEKKNILIENISISSYPDMDYEPKYNYK